MEFHGVPRLVRSRQRELWKAGVGKSLSDVVIEYDSITASLKLELQGCFPHLTDADSLSTEKLDYTESEHVPEKKTPFVCQHHRESSL